MDEFQGDIPHPRGVKKCIVENVWKLIVDFSYEFFLRKMENIATKCRVLNLLSKLTVKRVNSLLITFNSQTKEL